MATMTNPIIPEDSIRMRSYLIWEGEGRPEGRHLEHWLRATEELQTEAMKPAAKATSAAAPGRCDHLCHAMRASSAGTNASVRRGTTRIVKSLAGREAGARPVKT